MTLPLFIKKIKNGFTLIELLLAMVIAAILISLAYASYRVIIDDINNGKAIADLYLIELKIEQFITLNNALPLNLSTLDIPDDPWGQPYQYLNFSTVNGNGQKRKDQNLVPINNDYDLYSMGPDGQSVSPLTAAPSHDDIIRANNGGFMGVATDY